MFEKKYAWTPRAGGLAGCDTTMQTIGELSPDAGGGGADGGDGTEAGGSDAVVGRPDRRRPPSTPTSPIMGDDDDATLPAPWIEVWRDDFRGAAARRPTRPTGNSSERASRQQRSSNITRPPRKHVPRRATGIS
jgi:hypothetical protein